MRQLTTASAVVGSTLSAGAPCSWVVTHVVRMRELKIRSPLMTRSSAAAVATLLMTAIVILCVGLLIGVSLYVAALVTASLQRVVFAVQSVAGGDLTAEIAVTSSDELIPIGGDPTRCSVCHSLTCVGNTSSRAAWSPPEPIIPTSSP